MKEIFLLEFWVLVSSRIQILPVCPSVCVYVCVWLLPRPITDPHLPLDNCTQLKEIRCSDVTRRSPAAAASAAAWCCFWPRPIPAQTTLLRHSWWAVCLSACTHPRPALQPPPHLSISTLGADSPAAVEPRLSRRKWCKERLNDTTSCDANVPSSLPTRGQCTNARRDEAEQSLRWKKKRKEKGTYSNSHSFYITVAGEMSAFTRTTRLWLIVFSYTNSTEIELVFLHMYRSERSSYNNSDRTQKEWTLFSSTGDSVRQKEHNPKTKLWSNTGDKITSGPSQTQTGSFLGLCTLFAAKKPPHFYLLCFSR